jgi:hypothetical protein
MRFLIPLIPAVMLLALSAPSTASAAGPEDKKPGDKAPAEKAPPPATVYNAEVLVLHATNGDKGIDARIGDMPELKKPPFSSYKSYELLQKVRHPLEKERPRTLDLPNGRVLQTKLLDVLPEDSVRFTASINQPGGKTFLPLLEVKAKHGQSFIVAGQSYKGGILVLVIRIVK